MTTPTPIPSPLRRFWRDTVRCIAMDVKSQVCYGHKAPEMVALEELGYIDIDAIGNDAYTYVYVVTLTALGRQVARL